MPVESGSEAGKPDEIGYINTRREALLALLFRSSKEQRILQIDTGCNLEVVLMDRTLVDDLREPDEPEWYEQATVADGFLAYFKIVVSRVRFFGILRKISVYVPESTPARPLPESRPFIRGEPIGMIGSKLLRTTKLVIDYPEETVRISENV